MKTKRSHNNLPENALLIVKCGCGYEFHLVPDLNIMSEIIERHVEFHQTKYSLLEKEADQIRDDLIFQTLQLAMKHEG